MYKIATHHVKLAKDPETSQRYNYFLCLSWHYSKKYYDNLMMKSNWKSLDCLFGRISSYLYSLMNQASDEDSKGAERPLALDIDYEVSTRASFNSDCREEDAPEVSLKDTRGKLIWKAICKQRLIKFGNQA